MEGIASADTEYFVVMDADFQHPPASIGDIMDRLLEGKDDLVIGVRQTKEPLSLTRRLGSGGAHKLAATYLWLKRQQRSKDIMSGFFGGRTAVIKQIILSQGDRFEKKGFKALFDILKNAPKGTKIDEIEFEFGDRAGGKSKLSSDIVLSVMKQCGMVGKATGWTLQFFLINRAGRIVGFLILVAIFAIVISLGTNPPKP